MERWNDGTWCRGRRWGAMVLLLAIVPSFRLAAQVGHDPSHSPYRDVRRGATLVLTFGHLGARAADPAWASRTARPEDSAMRRRSARSAPRSGSRTATRRGSSSIRP